MWSVRRKLAGRRNSELKMVRHATLVRPWERSYDPGTTGDADRSGHSQRRPPRRTTTAQHPRTGPTISSASQYRKRRLSPVETRGLGVLVGSIRHTGIGVGRGALIGAGFGLAKVLFTRGDEISLPIGTRIEMVLQRPLIVQQTSQSPRADAVSIPGHNPDSPPDK